MSESRKFTSAERAAIRRVNASALSLAGFFFAALAVSAFDGPRVVLNLLTAAALVNLVIYVRLAWVARSLLHDWRATA